MIHLTEVTKKSDGKMHFLPILVNPLEIALVQSSDVLKEETPIIGAGGENGHILSVRIVRLRGASGNFITVKESTAEIEALINRHDAKLRHDAKANRVLKEIQS